MANKKLSATITIGGAVASSLRSAFGTVKNETDKLGSTIKNLTGRQAKLSEAIRVFGQQGKNVDGMRERYAAVTAQVDRLRAAHERLLSVERAQAQNLKLQQDLRSKIADTAVVGAAVALPTVAAFKKSSEFNHQLQAIGNTANLTDNQIKEMGRGLLTLSDKTGQSADTMKNALGFLVAAGQDVSTAQGNLLAIGRTATATDSEIEDVAKATFTLGDALNVNPSKMQKALDILVQSGQEGSFEFKNMAAELPTLAGAFQALKITGVEAVGTLGAALQIARKGAPTASEAANNMANFLAKILSPETLKKAEKLGSNLYGVVSGAQAKGQNPIEAAIKEIDRITKGGDQKLLGELFGDMQVQNFVRPMLQNLDEYQRIKAKAMSADGVTDRDFEKMLATSKVQTDLLTNSFHGLVKVVGDAVAPVIGSLAQGLTPVVRAARDFVQANPKLIGGVIASAAAFTTLRLALLGGRLGFAMLGGKMLSVVGVIAKMQAGFALAGAVSLPVIGAVAAGGLLIYRYWDGIKEFFAGVFDGFLTGIQPVVSVFRDLWAALEPIHPVFALVGDGVKAAWEWFSKLLEPVTFSQEELRKAGNAGRTFGEMLAAGIDLVLTPLQLLIKGILWLRDNGGAVIDSVKNAFPKVMSIFGGDDEQALPASPTPPALPMPAMATAPGAGGPGYTDNSQAVFNITQQPGQDARALAREITQLQDQQRAARQRGSLYDGAVPQ